MRVIVFFDLPTDTDKDKNNYQQFRKFLIKNGFIMMQYSVYSKLVLNNTAESIIKGKVKTHCPENGIVQMFSITEKQFTKMEYIAGSSQKKIIDSDKRLVIL
jgi:CRISPR-associated protein Cas2